MAEEPRGKGRGDTVKRYVLTPGSGFGKHHQLLDRETGIRWHINPEMVHLLNKSLVEQYKAPKPYVDRIPLSKSCKRGAETVYLQMLERRKRQHIPAKGRKR